MCRPSGGVWCPWMGSGGSPGPWRGSDTVGMGSSVELPLDDVRRHVKKVGREDHGDPEGVPVVEEGQ